MKKILVVDDEKEVGEFLRDYFADLGFQTCAVTSGKAAIEKAQTLKPDLIILDVQMPGMDGVKVLEEVKKIQPDVKVIMVTGDDCKETIEGTLHGGANFYIKKPVELNYLEKHVQRILEGKRSS